MKGNKIGCCWMYKRFTLLNVKIPNDCFGVPFMKFSMVIWLLLLFCWSQRCVMNEICCHKLKVIATNGEFNRQTNFTWQLIIVIRWIVLNWFERGYDAVLHKTWQYNRVKWLSDLRGNQDDVMLDKEKSNPLITNWNDIHISKKKEAKRSKSGTKTERGRERKRWNNTIYPKCMRLFV